jgi:hypothetical protein
VEYAEPIKVEDKVPAALKRRGELHSDTLPLTGQEPSSPPLETVVRREPGEWKLAVPLAAFFAWLWYRERKRRTE